LRLPIECQVSATIAGEPIDWLLQPAAGRRKRLLVADLESTLIENEMLDELGSLLGIGSKIAQITRRAMNGEIDFAGALAARVELLAGAETRLLAEAATRIRLTQGAAALVATMQRAGAETALVTGGFTIFADRVAAQLGVARIVANRLEIAGGRLTGRVLPPIVTGQTKRRTLLALARELGIAADAVVAVGDGANDLPMLDAAGLGIAFHAKPAVAAAARWRIDHADLTGLLYAQSYRREEIFD
jgi:phosphoserine phosphatase